MSDGLNIFEKCGRVITQPGALLTIQELNVTHNRYYLSKKLPASL